MDPFEVRIRFTQLIANMTASVTSSNKAAQYALKYRDLDEDLHSCILEQLERVGLNSVSWILMLELTATTSQFSELHYEKLTSVLAEDERVGNASQFSANLRL